MTRPWIKHCGNKSVGELCHKCAEMKRAYHREKLQEFRRRNPHHSRDYMRPQREVARAIKFCLECCARPAIRGRAVCAKCYARTLLRRAA